MKLLPLEYLTVFITLLFSLEISQDQLNHANKEIGEITLIRYSENKSSEKDYPNLELRKNESRQTNQGEKVETIVINGPVTKYSKVRLINLFTLQKIVFLKKNSHLLSQHCHLFSKTLHISTLVNILRI
jgi:hypothetical protein